MAVLVTGDQVIEDIRQRLGLPAYTSSTPVTLTGIQGMVTDSAVSLTGILHAIGDDYLTAVSNLTTVPNSSLIVLTGTPYKFLTLKRLHWVAGTDNKNVELRRANAYEMEGSTGNPAVAWDEATDIRYRYMGDSLYVWPTPSQSYTLTVYYGRPLTFEFGNPYGYTETYPFWKDWVVNDVCHKIRLMEEKYPAASQYLQQREVAEKYIRESAPRDQFGVVQVRDVWSEPDPCARRWR
jgi:hypothetical protein